MLSRKPLFILVLTLLMLLVGLQARADNLYVEIIGGGASRHAIAVVPFQDEASRLGGALTPIIRNDLNLTGLFRIVDASAVTDQPATPDTVHYPAWQTAGAQSLAIGTVGEANNGQVTISFNLMDVAQQKSLTSGQFTVAPERYRQVAHTIADMIYEAITGQKGFFNTRIVYVLKQGTNYQLQVADMDGQHAKTVVRSREPIMSPAWAPDGRRIAYVSFETNKPVVWVQDLQTGKRFAVADYKGSNSAPAWSPDGSRLAVVLTTTGNSEIYLVSANGGSRQRLTYSNAIDTEPTWAPDGSKILFVSDRSGGPQIYSMPVSGGEATRMTWQGSYNVSPKISPDGKRFTYIQRTGGNFRVMMQDIGVDNPRAISQDAYDERPSFAPNGSMVLYASDLGGRSVLYAATPDGSSKVRLGVINGEIQDPAWGPFNVSN